MIEIIAVILLLFIILVYLDFILLAGLFVLATFLVSCLISLFSSSIDLNITYLIVSVLVGITYYNKEVNG